MIGDAAYGLPPTLITGFNKMLSGLRAKVEHSFGLLKGRFTSLRSLRIHIDSRKKILDASMHVSACVVLHNILLTCGIADARPQDTQRWVQEQEDVERLEEPPIDFLHNDGDESDDDMGGRYENEFTKAQIKLRYEQAERKREAIKTSALAARGTKRRIN